MPDPREKGEFRRGVRERGKSVGWLLRFGKRERNNDDPFFLKTFLVFSVEEKFFFYIEIDLAAVKQLYIAEYRLKSSTDIQRCSLEIVEIA